MRRKKRGSNYIAVENLHKMISSRRMWGQEREREKRKIMKKENEKRKKNWYRNRDVGLQHTLYAT